MVFSQAPLDTLNIVSPIDSVAQKKFQKVDSIQSSFKFKSDSLQRIYKQPLNKIDSMRASVQHKIDSLNSLSLSTNKFTSKADSLNARYNPILKLNKKLDSLTAIQNKKLAELNQKVDQLKSKATDGIKEVTLPPQMQEPVDKLTQSIKSYVPSLPNGKLQEFIPGKLPGLKELEIPKGKIPDVKNLARQANGMSELGKYIPKSDELNKITGELSKVKGVDAEAGGLAKDAQHIATGKMDEVKHIDKTIEKQALKMDE